MTKNHKSNFFIIAMAIFLPLHAQSTTLFPVPIRLKVYAEEKSNCRVDVLKVEALIRQITESNDISLISGPGNDAVYLIVDYKDELIVNTVCVSNISVEVADYGYFLKSDVTPQPIKIGSSTPVIQYCNQSNLNMDGIKDLPRSIEYNFKSTIAQCFEQFGIKLK